MASQSKDSVGASVLISIITSLASHTLQSPYLPSSFSISVKTSPHSQGQPQMSPRLDQLHSRPASQSCTPDPKLEGKSDGIPNSPSCWHISMHSSCGSYACYNHSCIDTTLLLQLYINGEKWSLYASRAPRSVNGAKLESHAYEVNNKFIGHPDVVLITESVVLHDNQAYVRNDGAPLINLQMNKLSL